MWIKLYSTLQLIKNIPFLQNETYLNMYLTRSKDLVFPPC